MTAKKEVSLLPESENPNSFGARSIKWLTNSGRVIIIVTELLVVAAFISRFWLDRKNSDLSEIIRQQQAILATTKDFEQQYSALQQKLTTIKNLYSNEPDYGQKLNSLIQSTPQDIIYNDLIVSRDKDTKKISASVILTAYNESSIVDFITNLTLNPDIEVVNLNQIEKKSRENKYSISISLVFKNTAAKT
jgi:Tfp pilus assembly protein PilN